jgi:thiamine pyrophosphokinase
LKSKTLQDNLDAIVGDLDSLTPEARTYFNSKPTPAKIILDPDQYSTDFGKAVKHVRVQCPGMDIVAVGGLGGRVDQGLSQLHHLYLFQMDPRYAEGRMYFLSSQNLTFLLKKGKHRIRVREVGWTPEVFGKHVGILPMKGPSIISTKGLEWDVTDWETEFGGQISTSNHVLPETETVEVETDKDIVFTIALK